MPESNTYVSLNLTWEETNVLRNAMYARMEHIRSQRKELHDMSSSPMESMDFILGHHMNLCMHILDKIENYLPERPEPVKEHPNE